MKLTADNFQNVKEAFRERMRSNPLLAGAVFANMARRYSLGTDAFRRADREAQEAVGRWYDARCKGGQRVSGNEWIRDEGPEESSRSWGNELRAAEEYLCWTEGLPLNTLRGDYYDDEFNVVVAGFERVTRSYYEETFGRA